MVGGGNKRDDGPLGINSTNVFAALESLRRKKKSDKEQGSSRNKGSKNQTKEPEPQVFWAPAPLTVKSWADVDDDDDYYATTAPLQSVWGTETQPPKESSSPLEESESEEDGLDEGDDDIDEEHSHEPEAPVPTESEPVQKKPPQASLAAKESERQLSKKELKKKELAELEAVLAELGINNETNGQDELHGDKEEKIPEEPNSDDVEKKESAPVVTETKTSKKKKKKEKSSKEPKDPQQEQPNGTETNGPDEALASEPAEEDTSTLDMKERLKKMASMKKKKSSKEMDAAAKAAAVEAAARSARLAAAKKKEKNHYNQQPVR